MARDYFNLENLRTLLETRPMVLPFSHEVLTCVLHVGFWAVNQLQKLQQEFKKTGNINATWCAYQLELILEKLIWGRPLCWRSKQNSINLGPGALHSSRSSTDSFGFMALESLTCCMGKDDEIPYILSSMETRVRTHGSSPSSLCVTRSVRHKLCGQLLHKTSQFLLFTPLHTTNKRLCASSHPS